MADATKSSHPDECRNVWQKWGGFLDKELSNEERDRIATHLDQCGACRGFVETQSQFNRLLRKSLMEEAQNMPAGLREKVLAVLDRKSRKAPDAAGAHDHEHGRHDHAHGHDHGHSHDHGEPGHVHDHGHEHTHEHSHGLNVISRLALVLSALMLVVGIYFVTIANKANSDSENAAAQLKDSQKQLAEARTDLENARKELDNARGELRNATVSAEMSRKLADNEAIRAKGAEDRAKKAEAELAELKTRYDENVKKYDKLLAAFKDLIAAGDAVMKMDNSPQPPADMPKTWKEMFPEIDAPPTKSIDNMEPKIWDVTPFNGVKVLWMVFDNEKGDKTHRFTLMTFDRAYMEKVFGRLDSKVELVKDGMAIIAWANEKDKGKTYHAVIGAGGLDMTRAQLAALK